MKLRGCLNKMIKNNIYLIKNVFKNGKKKSRSDIKFTRIAWTLNGFNINCICLYNKRKLASKNLFLFKFITKFYIFSFLTLHFYSVRWFVFVFLNVIMPTCSCFDEIGSKTFSILASRHDADTLHLVQHYWELYSPPIRSHDVLTTCRMVGLQPTMKGRLRKPLMRWAIRTGSSLCRYLALLWDHTHTHEWEKVSVCINTADSYVHTAEHLPGCGAHQGISQNTTGWLMWDAPRPEETSTQTFILQMTGIINKHMNTAQILRLSVQI